MSATEAFLAASGIALFVFFTLLLVTLVPLAFRGFRRDVAEEMLEPETAEA